MENREWPLVEVQEACDLIVDCVNKTAPVVEGPTPFRMIRTTNVRHGRIDLDNCRFVTAETYDKWTRRARVEKGDVLLTREAPIGEVGQVAGNEKIFLGQRIMQYRANPKVLDPRFLFYAFLSPSLQHQFSSHEGSGSVVSHIRVGDCYKFKIPLPSLSEQKVIGGILGLLDDKIELNRRMNQTLEQLAQTLFRQWFLSAADEREQVSLSSMIDFDPKTPVKKGTNTRFLPMTEVPTQGFTIGTLDSRPYSGGAKFRLQDTLLARITPCLENGKTAYVDFLDLNEVAAGSTEFIVMRGKGKVSSEFVYCLARSTEFRKYAIAQMVGSSGRQRVAKESLETYSFPIPDEDQLIMFGEIAKPLFARISANSRESRTLASLRDTLLPKLLSGSFTVRLPEELLA